MYAGHGRGIFLMRELMDEVKFQKGGRQVVMKKTARQKSRQRSR
ncbi:MAG: ATP-binding protein [Candidatus Acidiferrales bacterium]